MLGYLARRLLYVIPTLLAISVVVFLIINLPPGDFATSLVAYRRQQGIAVGPEEVEQIRAAYGLDEPIYVQYWYWISDLLFRFDLGVSFEFNRPVADMISERLPATLLLAAAALLFTWFFAFPIGIYAAVRQYSIGDYLATTIGFLGLATPNFLLALILMYLAYRWFEYVPAGICSPDWCDASWNLGKLLDALGHLWLPVVVLGTAGMAGLIRILRANLLDELRKPYVVAARARGVPERRLLVKYPLRVAMNPFISTVGWVLPGLFAGDIIVGQLLGLPTIGPLLLGALRQQDMYLAGSLIMVISVLTVIGTLISDLLLAWTDPRVRLGHGGSS
ncbi:ABC transporter permease [Streptomyces aidingensis]|uniref:Peptide/nickel transport system permease protein n=1 Tax=Streptomyces aidingensis TaxID=910347 RepID=A0A1I1JSV4_9ACTN|nr:ABC transporter permease [Streptomyces aidingensis]SFC48933.1 peptide/nickel transport system permease protein [Streptomyces aidingensis]